jgi:hypothetical protein
MCRVEEVFEDETHCEVKWGAPPIPAVGFNIAVDKTDIAEDAPVIPMDAPAVPTVESIDAVDVTNRVKTHQIVPLTYEIHSWMHQNIR